MLKTFKVYYFLSNPNYLIETTFVRTCFLFAGFNFAGVNFPQNMQGFKLEKKNKKCDVHILVRVRQQHQHLT